MGYLQSLRCASVRPVVSRRRGRANLTLFLALAALASGVGSAAAQQPTAIPQRLQIPRNTQTWQRVDTGAFKMQTHALTVRVPPKDLRTARTVVRDGVTRLEAPLAAIVTGTGTLNLDLSVDPDPGLFCKRDGCTGTVQVEVVDADRRSRVVRLPAPMQIDFYGVDAVTPDSVTVGETRTLRHIAVSSRTPTATLTVHPRGLESVEVPLPVRTLELQLNAGSESMDAWGLETLTLSVAPVEGLDANDAVEIQLRGDGLRVEPSVVQVTSTKGATAKIRSRGVGRGSVRAVGPSYVREARIDIAVRPPWLFFLFALIGGLIGAFAREKTRKQGGTGSGLLIQVVAVALVALLLAAGTAIGVNVTGLSLPMNQVSEILGAVEAGIIALAIDPIFDRLGGKNKDDTQKPSAPEPTTTQQPV